MNTIVKSLAAVFALTVSSLCLADLVVIANPSAGVTLLTEDDVSRIFLGKSKSFPSGGQVLPLNQQEGSAIRDEFNLKVCKKNSSQYKAYWSQLVFTGKGTLPKEVGGDAAVKALVASNPNMIGYIDSGAVDDTVKIVFRLRQ